MNAIRTALLNLLLFPLLLHGVEAKQPIDVELKKDLEAANLKYPKLLVKDDTKPWGYRFSDAKLHTDVVRVATEYDGCKVTMTELIEIACGNKNTRTAVDDRNLAILTVRRATQAAALKLERERNELNRQRLALEEKKRELADQERRLAQEKRMVVRAADLATLKPEDVEGCLIFSGKTFLGTITNKYDSDSVANTYGTHGSKYSTDSIFNKYGEFGDKYSNNSVFNKFASEPPKIVDKDGTFRAYLTLNENMTPRVNTDTLLGWIARQ